MIKTITVNTFPASTSEANNSIIKALPEIDLVSWGRFQYPDQNKMVIYINEATQENEIMRIAAGIEKQGFKTKYEKII